VVTREEIARALVELGLERGDCVIAHSSLSSFGRVTGGADAVVDAVLDALGAEGTAVFPTYTGGRFQDESIPVEKRIYTGAIPKAAYRRGDFLKGTHPFYAICARGPLAIALVAACDRYIFASAEGKFLHLMAQRGGKALLLGVDHNSNSSVHLVEEFGRLEYKVQDKPWWLLTVEEFRRLPAGEQARLIEAHQGSNLPYDTVSRFNAIEPLLVKEHAIRFGRVGSAQLRLMRIADIERVGLDAVKRDPWLLREKVAKG
jgi:aminoglycoside 3-N-acetyltransferase